MGGTSIWWYQREAGTSTTAASTAYIARMRTTTRALSGRDITLSTHRPSRVRVIMKAACWRGRSTSPAVRRTYVCNVTMDSRITAPEGIANRSARPRNPGT